MKYIKTFESFVSEGKETFIEVSVRDAKKALEYLNDEYRGKFKTSASNKYSFKKEDDAYNALQDLEDIDIEVINTNIEESSAAVSENVDMEELQRELKALKAKHPKAKVTYSFVKDGKKGYVLHVKESDESINEADIPSRFKNDTEEYKYLIHTRPKYSLRQILPGKGLQKAIADIGIEDMIANSNLSPKNLSKVKKEVLDKLQDGNFDKLLSARYSNTDAVRRNIFHTLVHWHLGESLAPVSEGKNKFRYDYEGWQQVYHAYNQTTHKTIDKDPMAFIDWLAKNTQPPQV